jgi:hypothetical protein
MDTNDNLRKTVYLVRHRELLRSVGPDARPQRDRESGRYRLLDAGEEL